MRPDARLDLAGMFVSSSPSIDKRFEQSESYNNKAAVTTIFAPSDDYHIYVCTDTHITKTRNRWEKFIQAYRADMLCPIAIHLGDIIDARTDFEYVRESLIPESPKLKFDTLMAIAGNHDIYFKQWDKFVAAFKTSSYYFIVQTPSGDRDLFVCYDSADGTIGNKQLNWLKATLEWADTQNFRHIIACTHTHLFKRDTSQGHTSNFTIEETYSLLNLLTSHNVKMIWNGHDHSREITEVKNMTCIILNSMRDEDKTADYMLVTMGDNIHYDFIPVEL